MQARYDGKCPDCHSPITAGVDEIQRSGRKWVHARCSTTSAPPSVLKARRPRARTADNPDEDWTGNDETEYQQGIAHARHISDTRKWFGEEAAVAEEYAWDMRFGDY